MGFQEHMSPQAREVTNIGQNANRGWASACHAFGFFMIPLPVIGNVLAPLLVWLLKRSASPFVDVHGRQAVNFQLTLSLCISIIGGLGLMFIYSPFGWFLLAAAFFVAAAGVGLSLVAAIQASRGATRAEALFFYIPFI